MADEDPAIVDAVTEATNGIGSEALAAISNLGGGSGSIATSVVSRIGATVSGQAGGFAPKAITTITKHGLAAIDRVEPIRGVDRGYRAIARDANGLESIRTVLDLDPREYDVTVTREDGVAIVEFVQQEPDPEPALPPGEDEESEAATSSTISEPMEPVTGAGSTGQPTEATTTEPRPLGADSAGHAQHAAGRPAPVNDPGEEVGREVAREVQQARAEAETTKVRAEAEKAEAEAEKAKAEAAAAKARAEAEKAEAEADAEAARREQPRSTPARTSESDRERAETEQAASDTAFSASREFDSGFEAVSEFDAEPRDSAEASETAGCWGLREESNAADAAGDDDATGTTSGDGEADEGHDLGEEDGFGGFTPATPVEDEPPEYVDGGTIETSISVHESRGAVADGGTDESDGDTGKFQF